MPASFCRLTTAPIRLSLLLMTAGASAETPEPNRIVYWGNTQTGKSVRVYNTADAEKKAEAQVKAIGGNGWTLLENSTVPGFGAAICKREGANIQFYLAHGYANSREAVTAAKSKANGGSFCSNALWKVLEPVGHMERPASVSGTLQSWIREALTKEKKTAEDYQRECDAPRGPGRLTPESWRPAAWCPSKTVSGNPGVRG